MKSLLAISFLLSLCLAFTSVSGAADKTRTIDSAVGDTKSGTEVTSPEAVTPAADESPNAEKVLPKAKKAAKPVLEKPEGFHVKVHDGRLSVNVKDQKFGDVISLIANSAGFDVDIGDDVFDMKLSTRFEKTGLQRGILRLIFLVDQKNYSIHYRPDGSIKKLEVHGELASGELSLTGARPSSLTTEKTPQRGMQRMTRPPSPVVVPDRNRRKQISIPTQKEELEEPMEEDEVMELEFRHFTPLAGQGGGDESPTTEPEPEPEPTSGPSPEPAPGPALGDCSEDPACNIIPEGPIPSESDLLNAPIIP